MKWVSKDLVNSHIAIDNLKNDLIQFEEYDNYNFNSISHVKIKN